VPTHQGLEGKPVARIDESAEKVCITPRRIALLAMDRPPQLT
jgi:hypothetical protein